MKPLGLTDEEIADASADELRVAYRELLAENVALRELISERTCAAVGDLREKGLKFNGNLPYGLESGADNKLKASRYETKLIAEVKLLKAEGRSLRDISRTLTERNFVNRKGKPLDAKQVSRILAAIDEAEDKAECPTD
jgi:DNA invertase Pin-like site-specific DNA recombinase